MALTPQVRSSQVNTQAVTDAEPDVRASQVNVLAVAIYPTEFIEDSQTSIQAVTEAGTDIRASQVNVMVVGRGRVADPYLRVWTFWQDNHWFYVLRLPTGWTLVWDDYAKQWYRYSSGTSNTWRPTHGTNWLGSGALMGTYGSNVVCGDDGNGALYFLNPNSPTDDDAIVGAALQVPFTREVTGQVSVRNHNYLRCYGVELMGSIGDNDADLTDVTLSVSDDAGHSFTDYGTVSITADDYAARVEWLSGLGSFTAPGRLFRITDDGVLQRIDWLEMRGDEDG